VTINQRERGEHKTADNRKKAGSKVPVRGRVKEAHEQNKTQTTSKGTEADRDNSRVLEMCFNFYLTCNLADGFHPIS